MKMKRHAISAGLAVLLLAGSVQAAEVPVFRTDVLPVLTKAGCNAGACHGAATGQGGFRLSLLGYDPEEDFERIARESGTRRIEVGRPLESLILRKASNELEHEGGRKLGPGSAGYETLRRWIAAGAPFGPPGLRVTGIAVEPTDLLLESGSPARPLQVRATLSNGAQRDVTALALYTSNDEAVVGVSKAGQITAAGSGLASVMVRFSGQVAAARVAVPYDAGTNLPAALPPAGFIDEHVGAELQRLRVPASPPSAEAEFLRRVSLDVTGRLPSAQVTRRFLDAPPSDAKRDRLIEELLVDEAFVDFWTLKLADLLLVQGKGEGVRAYHAWLREQVADDVPLDRVARELVTGGGDTRLEGPANFMMLANDPRDLAEHVGRIFLGARIACARCHAHPSDRWTQEDYHRFAAYFARVQRDDGVVRVASRGEVDHPKTGRAMTPKPLGTEPEPMPGTNVGDGDRREELARWLASADNPFFARTFVNRVWKHLFGRGLVEPVDDLRPTNPASHPALLDALATHWVAHGYRLRPLVRTMVRSRTYQLGSVTVGVNAGETRLFSHAYARPLPAEVFADAVAQVTGVADGYEDHPAGTRAVQLASPSTPSTALDVLGRCRRTRPCETGSSEGGGLAQALHLINGSTINGKLSGGLVGAWKDRPFPEALEEVYLRALVRRPSAEEIALWESFAQQGEDREQTLADLVWVLLNSREFAFNH
jgi:hypothetical protein